MIVTNTITAVYALPRQMPSTGLSSTMAFFSSFRSLQKATGKDFNILACCRYSTAFLSEVKRLASGGAIQKTAAAC